MVREESFLSCSVIFEKKYFLLWAPWYPLRGRVSDLLQFFKLFLSQLLQFFQLNIRVRDHYLEFVVRVIFWQKIETEEEMVLDLVEIVMLSLDPDRVLLDGGIFRNKVFVGIIDWYEINGRIESWWMYL